VKVHVVAAMTIMAARWRMLECISVSLKNRALPVWRQAYQMSLAAIEGLLHG
jgi:hypothetical protein